MFTRLFPLWVSAAAVIALIEPRVFTWFSGPWITYGLGGIMLGMGLTLQWSDFAQVAKTPTWVILGMLLQFTVMPFLGWALGILFELPSFFAVGLILVACCPGGLPPTLLLFSQRQCSLIGSHDHLLYLWCHSTHSFFDCHPFR